MSPKDQFLIYVNELPEIIPKDICIKMYADDVKLYNIYKTKQERSIMHEALQNISLVQ